MDNKIKKIINYVLYAFVFLIPWQTRYIYKYLTLGGEIFEHGKLSLYLNEIILLILIFLICFYNFKNKKNNYQKILDFKILFLFLLIVLISFWGALNWQLYFYGFIKLLEVIVLYLLIQKIDIDYFKVRIAFIGSIFIHSCLGIYQFFSQKIFASKYLGIAEQVSYQGGVSVLEGNFGRLLRAYGGFSHPNILGGFSVIAILFLVNIYLEKKKNSILFYSVLTILFIGLVLSFSRSAWLALFIALIFVFVSFLIKKIKIKPLFSILLILVLLSGISFYLFNDFLKTRIENQERLEVKSTTERIMLKNQAQTLIKDTWFLGSGFNNYIITVYNKLDSNLNVWEYQPVHNVYLLVLVELGILGFLLFIFLLVYFFFQTIKTKNINQIILGSVILVFIVVNFFDHYFYTYWSGLILFFLIISLIKKRR